MTIKDSSLILFYKIQLCILQALFISMTTTFTHSQCQIEHVCIYIYIYKYEKMLTMNKNNKE